MRTSKKQPKNSPSRADKLVAQVNERAAEAGIEIEPDDYSLEWYRADWPERKQTFIEREIKIRNAFHRNRLEPFILNDAQLELLEASNEAYEDPELEDNTLKCRRLGISTFYLADYFSDAVVESGHHVRVIAQDPKTLLALMKIIKTMYTNLRPEIKPDSKYNSKFDLEFNDVEKGVIDSRVSVSAVVPGQEEAGRGDNFTRLHETEIPFWKGDAEIASAALEEAAKGGKISRESTAKGIGDKFHREYQRGKRKVGGSRSHFFAWYWHREYQIPGAKFVQLAGVWYLLKPGQRIEMFDEEELTQARVTTYTKEEKNAQSLALQSELDCSKDILDHLKKKGYIGPDAAWHCDAVAAFIAYRRMMVEKRGPKKFRVEYPENDTDPFAQTGGGIFDPSFLVIKAIPREAEAGHTYKVALDPSDGVEGGNPYCITVQDCKTGEQVYEEGGIKKQDHQAKRCCELSDKYNAAEIGIESNKGEAAILEVEKLGYGHRLYRHLSADTEREVREGKLTYPEAMKRTKPGIPMSDRLKRLMVNNFERAWRTGDFKCCSEELIEEAKVFIQDGEQMRAKSGYTDDRVMANIIDWYLVENSMGGDPDFASSGEKNTSAQLGGY